MKKLILSLLMVTLFAFSIAGQANAAAGTTAKIQAPNRVNTNMIFKIQLSQLSDGGDYIIYVDVTTYGGANITFTADGTSHIAEMKMTSAGTTTISVGGATAGVAASAIDATTVTSRGLFAGFIDPEFFTDMLPIVIPIVVVVMVVGIIFMQVQKQGRSS